MRTELSLTIRSVSFAPSELVAFQLFFSHGLRRGLHSFAASRLDSRGTYSIVIGTVPSHAHPQRPPEALLLAP